MSVLEALHDDELAVAMVAAGLPETDPTELGFEDLMGLVVSGLDAIGFREVRSRSLRSMLAHLDGVPVIVDEAVRSVWGSLTAKYTADRLVSRLRALAAAAAQPSPPVEYRERHLWAVA
ncbi:hypothetical protein [Glycomyces tenuis]|uniref:hypothetical protein n=1 Tax=Glycomyces tenuis TaxID=58116 RepID=UPI0004213C05|nr:hypothetical protein [Glycomyces tenuis]